MSFNTERQSFLLQEPDQLRMLSLYERAFTKLRSPSHDQYHLDITLVRARELTNWCQTNGMAANWETIFASVCLHDLGRNNPKLQGLESIQASIEEAIPILQSCGYTSEETKAICQAIQSHDQPDLSPTNPEALILKEADFLAGSGAWGIFRTIAWGIESGRSTDQIIKTFRERMPQRIDSLTLPPAREIAWREWPLVNLFLTQLENQKQYQERESYLGKYIVIEGISGSGKDTQEQLLAEYLAAKDKKVVTLAEPTNLGRDLLRLTKEVASKAGCQITQSQRALIMATDRIGVIEEIKKYLKLGYIVIEIRSFLSSMAYQGENTLAMAEALFLNRFALRPDLVIYLETTPKVALSRTRKREKQGVSRGDFEEEEIMTRTLAQFHQAFAMLPTINITIIPSDSSPEDVFELVKRVFEKENAWN